VALYTEPRASVLEDECSYSSPDALARIPHAVAVKYSVLACRVDGNDLHVVVPFLTDESTLDRVRAITGMRLLISEAPREKLRSRIAVEYVNEQPREAQEPGSDAPVIRAVELLHESAVKLGASDIHLEPTRAGGRVRLRVDGILRESDRISSDLFSPIVSRVKLLAAMDIAERRQPQDGRYVLERHGHPLDARVSSMPTIAGEKVVIRLLDMQTEVPSLDALGMSTAILERYRAAIHAAHGFVVVCGPTGSGKTTTLYASIAERNVESEHVCTVEDPVEVQMAGVAQVQVNARAGVTFASALRAFLRQDPNVIMLGEMRDAESASVAMSAALAGQLVMTTLHASDAPRAIERLLELGLKPQTMAAGLSVIVAQRLVRRLCAHCRRAATPDATLRRVFRLDRSAATFEAIGCSKCGGSGYRGRTGIFELLPVTSSIRSAIARGDVSLALCGTVPSEPYEPMISDGIARVLNGETSLRELQRVLGTGEL
jgi:type IV pilus assembly protein PilB